MATGILIAGAVISGVSAIAGGISAKKQAESQADITEQQGAFAKASALDQAERFREQGESFLSGQRVGFASAGVQLDTGSPLAVMKKSEENLEQDVKRIQEAGENAATLAGNQAAAFRKQGQGAFLGGILGGGSTFLTGFGNSGFFKQ